MYYIYSECRNLKEKSISIIYRCRNCLRNKIVYDCGHTGRECDFRTASRPPAGKPTVTRHTSFPGKTRHALPFLRNIHWNTALYGKLILTRTIPLRIVQQFQLFIFDPINLISLCLTLWNNNICCSRGESNPEYRARCYTDTAIPAPTCGSRPTETRYLLRFHQIYKNWRLRKINIYVSVV
jgi:hypothetical protein